MRKASLAAVAALIGMGVANAEAADLRSGSLKDGPVAESYTPFWGGLYIGGSAGFGVGNTSGQIDLNLPERWQRAEGYLENLLKSEYDMNGAIYGAHLGYNWQRGSLVYGLEAGFNGTSMDGSSPCGPLALGQCQRELDWYATGTARLGYASGNTLFYGFGGVAWGEVNTKVGVPLLGSFQVEGQETHVGWTAGLGLEHAFSDRFSVRVEYAHVDLGEENTSLTYKGQTVPYISDKVDMEFDTIKIGASYKLIGGNEALK